MGMKRCKENSITYMTEHIKNCRGLEEGKISSRGKKETLRSGKGILVQEKAFAWDP